MKFIRRAAIQELLERIDHRQPLIQEKCAEGLMAESGLAESIAWALAEQWTGLIETLKNGEEAAWQEQAGQFGAWCRRHQIPFEAVMHQLHLYKRAAMPLLVREYPGVEGYLEAHLALDEALTLLMGKIPGGYYLGDSSKFPA